MSDQHDTRSGEPWSVLSSVLLGAAAGYLLFAPGGRRLCDATIQLLDTLSFECSRFCQSSSREQQITAADTWKALERNLAIPKRPPAFH